MPVPPERGRAGRIHFVVALRAEAKPLIRHFRLSAAGKHGPFRYFSTPAGGLGLVLTGTGRDAARAAVTRLRAVRDSAWLNVGIAGHAEHLVGTAFLAHRIVDDATHRSWYPPLVFEPPCPTAAVRTVARACRDFPTDDLYDMEAAGFYDAAARCANHELVHCLKVVSDTRDQPASLLTAKRVSELVGSSLAEIIAVTETLRGLAADQARERAEPTGFRTVLSFAHFTTTQRRQLRRVLRRFAALCPDEDTVEFATSGDADSAKLIISRLEAHLEEQTPRFVGSP